MWELHFYSLYFLCLFFWMVITYEVEAHKYNLSLTHSQWNCFIYLRTLFALNFSGTCRNSFMWRKSFDEYWTHTWWHHFCNFWGAIEADGDLAKSQWRSHLWNPPLEVPEWWCHPKCVVSSCYQVLFDGGRHLKFLSDVKRKVG